MENTIKMDDLGVSLFSETSWWIDGIDAAYGWVSELSILSYTKGL